MTPEEENRLTECALASLPTDRCYSLDAFRSSNPLLETPSRRAGKRDGTAARPYSGMWRRPITDPEKVLRDTKEVVTRWRLSRRETERIETGKAPLSVVGRYAMVRGRF